MKKFATLGWRHHQHRYKVHLPLDQVSRRPRVLAIAPPMLGWSHCPRCHSDRRRRPFRLELVTALGYRELVTQWMDLQACRNSCMSLWISGMLCTCTAVPRGQAW